jgi:hypothetical protein
VYELEPGEAIETGAEGDNGVVVGGVVTVVVTGVVTVVVTGVVTGGGLTG